MPLPPTATILVAEPDAAVTSVVRHALAREGYQVLWADDNCDDMSANDAEVPAYGSAGAGSKTLRMHATRATNPDAS